MDVSLDREVRGHIFLYIMSQIIFYKVSIYIKVTFILFKISVP